MKKSRRLRRTSAGNCARKIRHVRVCHNNHLGVTLRAAYGFDLERFTGLDRHHVRVQLERRRRRFQRYDLTELTAAGRTRVSWRDGCE